MSTASHCQTRALTLVYLLISGTPVADARRLKYDVKQDSDYKQEVDAKTLVALNSWQDQEQDTQSDSGWCNPFSKFSLTYYKIEVLESGASCETGVCTAYELVRDKETPVLKIHHGQSWAVEHANGKVLADKHGEGFIWQLCENNKAAPVWDEQYNLFDAQYIEYGEENEKEGLREYVSFKWKDGNETKISGGMFLADKLVKDGLDRMHEGEGAHNHDEEDHAHHGADALKGLQNHDVGIVGNTAGYGAELTAFGGALTAGGFFLAATAEGIAISNSAIITAGMMATIGGGAIGAVLGAGVGAGIGVAGVAALVRLLRDGGLSGADKIWSKIWCLDFEVCHKDVKVKNQFVTTVVTTGKACPPL